MFGRHGRQQPAEEDLSADRAGASLTSPVSRHPHPSHGFTAISRARIAVCRIIDSMPRCLAVVEGAKVRPRFVTHSCTAR
ncbi:hypothetical protein V2I01_16185 [Micromonospora sp. BRA006-A]|nr:hypothetical protein [Micromonospora sp. BRA006-A]